MEELKYKFNLVAVIATIGAVIALIGVILAFNNPPGGADLLDLIVFVLVTLTSASTIKPNLNTKSALMNVVVGVLAIVISVLCYFRIAEIVEAAGFMDVGIGPWMMIAGSIIFTMFTLSDYLYKRKAN
jgi:hypothetical protein